MKSLYTCSTNLKNQPIIPKKYILKTKIKKLESKILNKSFKTIYNILLLMIYYKYGENGHIQYDWSHNIDHKIYQFFYQLVRPTNTEQLDILENELKNIFDVVFKDVNNIEKYNEQIMLLYKMVGHTRDIIYGKGERLLTYMLTFIWSLVDERLAYLLIDLMVKSPNIKDNIQDWFVEWY